MIDFSIDAPDSRIGKIGVFYALGGWSISVAYLLLMFPLFRGSPVARWWEQGLLLKERIRAEHMHFRSDEREPLQRTNLHRLPSRDQQNATLPTDESDTGAIQTVPHELQRDEVKERASRITAQLTIINSSSRKPASADRHQQSKARRRMSLIAVALFFLMMMSVPLLGSHFGVVAYMVGASQDGAPAPLVSTGAQAGIQQISTAVPTARPRPIVTPPTPKPTPPPPPPEPTYDPNGPYSNWTPPPGYTSYAVTEPSPDPWASSFGQCTWWAQYKRQDENFTGFGAALNWASAALARGYIVTSTPVANATVVFAPGVQGASSAGHVSHVEKILTGGWVLVSEMNFYWNGGGFARVDYRYIHVGAGVLFIH